MAVKKGNCMDKIRNSKQECLKFPERHLILIAKYKQSGEIDKAIEEFRKMIDYDPLFSSTYRVFFRFLIKEDRLDQIIPEAKRIIRNINDYNETVLGTTDYDRIMGGISPRGFLHVVQSTLLDRGIDYTNELNYSKAKKVFEKGIESLSLYTPLLYENLFKRFFNGLYLYNLGMEIFESDPYRAFFALYKASKFLDMKGKIFDIDYFSERIPLNEETRTKPGKEVLESLNTIKKQLQELGSSLTDKVRGDKRLKLEGEKAEYEVWLFKDYKPNVPYSYVDKHYSKKIKNYDLFVDETKGEVFFGKIYGEKALMIKRKNDRELSLMSGYPFQVLIRFLKRDGNAGTAEQIFDDVWTEDPVNIDNFENRVEQVITDLRKKLKKIVGIECPNKRYKFSKQIKYCLIKEKEELPQQTGPL